MQVSEQVVEVICRNKRDGKQMASQKLLQKLHPNITSWGSLLKMYGSRAISAQKNKKERESEVRVEYHEFSQILREINFRGSRSAKSAILTHLQALNLGFLYEFLAILKAEIYQKTNSEHPKTAVSELVDSPKLISRKI